MDSIRIKRGLKAQLPRELPLGELAFCTDTRELYVGMGEGSALRPVTNTEITEHLEEWTDTFGNLDKKYQDKFVEISNQFQNKYNGLEQEYATRLTQIDSNLDKITHLAPTPTGVDDTNNLKEFFSKGYTNVKLIGEYKINLNEGEALCSFIDAKNIKIDCSEATINDLKDDYGNNTPLTRLFEFTRCTNIYVHLNYTGMELIDKDTLLGYSGLTLIWLKDHCTNIDVTIKARNCRYGLLTGNYDDHTLGFNTHIVANIEGYAIGYPIALYNASNVKANVEVNTFHRATYIAGVDYGDFNIKSKNQHIADMVNLLTDALISPNTSKGCSNINIKAYDTKSTHSMPSSFLVGLALSRQFECQFKNLNIFFDIEATDNYARTLGGFSVDGTVHFTDKATLDNINIQGRIDRTNQMLPSGLARDIRIKTNTDSGKAKVSNVTLCCELLGVYAPDRETYICSDINNLNIINYKSNDNGMVLEGTGDIIFNNCIIQKLATNGNYSCRFSNTQFIEGYNSSTYDVTSTNSLINKNNALIKTKKITAHLVGEQVDLGVNTIPINSLLLGVTGYISETIEGATGLKIGTEEDPIKFCNANLVAKGTNITLMYQNQNVVSPLFFIKGSKIIITPRTSAFTGGKLELYINYIQIS